jgi:UMF1 family MFS transporter
LVLTFIFSTYFTKVIAPNEIVGTSLWSRGLTISGLLVALLSPFMGALADSGGYRKRFLLALTTIGVIGTAMLYTAQSGEVMKALLWFVIANIGVEMAMVFYNAFLPDIAPSSKMGRVSGYGWSFGYVGGLLAMLLAMTGFIEADTPWFGFSKENGEHIRATNLLVAAWLAVFSIPLFVWVKEKKQLTVKLERVFVSTIRQMMNTATDLRRHRQIVRLLAARLFYNDGILTIFSFGGIYAAGTFGFTFSEILTFGIVLNITAGLGAFALGFLDDVIGGKKTILISNLAFIVATLVAVLAPSKAWFWVAGIMVGTFSGPNQAASRSLMGRFVPANKENEFFGFYAFSGKATAFMGPLFLGILTEVFQNQRAGVAVVLVFFVIGSLILLSVDEKDGRASAGRE